MDPSMRKRSPGPSFPSPRNDLLPTSHIPVRRRRFLLFLALVLGTFFFVGVPWELPESLKDGSIISSGLSRANIVQLVKPSKLVDEIFGLLYVVTGGDIYGSDSPLKELNPTKTVDLSVYARGASGVNWKKVEQELNEKYPIVVFSKTYCQFSKKANALLQSYDLDPPPTVVEVDVRDDGDVIKQLLTRLTHHSTFPNILIKGQTIGGFDDLQNLHFEGQLKVLIENAGVKVQGDVPGPR